MPYQPVERLIIIDPCSVADSGRVSIGGRSKGLAVPKQKQHCICGFGFAMSCGRVDAEFLRLISFPFQLHALR